MEMNAPRGKVVEMILESRLGLGPMRGTITSAMSAGRGLRRGFQSKFSSGQEDMAGPGFTTRDKSKSPSSSPSRPSLHLLLLFHCPAALLSTFSAGGQIATLAIPDLGKDRNPLLPLVTSGIKVENPTPLSSSPSRGEA